MNQDNLNIIQSNAGLAADVRNMIGQTRDDVARTVNSGMTFLYWRIGKRIQMEVLQYERAEYGKEILATLSQELSAEFGRGYSPSAHTRMVKFSEVFSEGDIVATLSQQLSWSHFMELLPLDQPLQREFYAEMCRVERLDDLVRNWLRNRNTLEFLGIWEQPHNPGFNSVEFDGIKMLGGLNSFALTPKRWIEKTGANQTHLIPSEITAKQATITPRTKPICSMSPSRERDKGERAFQSGAWRDEKPALWPRRPTKPSGRFWRN